MMESLKPLETKINIEMSGDIQKYLVSAKQGDKATRYVVARLLNNGEEYTIPDDAQVVVNIKKPDGKTIYNECTFYKEEVKFELTNQALAVAGTANCEIEIHTSDNSQIISSATFEIEIDKKVGNDESIESSNEYTALQKLIADASKMDGIIKDVGNLSKDFIEHDEDASIHVTSEQKKAWNEGLSKLSEEIVALKSVYTAIPETIHIVVGNEFKMYYKNVFSRSDCNLWLGSTSGITVRRYADYLSITATSVIDKNIAWKIYDNNFNVVDSGSLEVIATDEKSQNAKVLVIGDSTVTQSNAVSQKLLACFSASGGVLTLLGTRGTSPALHEGRAGWSAKDYCTKASDSSYTNPFYNNGFDFSHYMSQQGYSGVDIVVIQLGINDIFSMTFENFTATATANYIQQMVASIVAYNSNIKVIVNLLSVPNGNGTSFTNAYGTTQIDFINLVNSIRMSKALIEKFTDSAYVTISPNNCVLDSTTDINDGVHPNSTGYAKLGQVIYETINGIFDGETSGGEEPTTVLWNLKNRSGVQEGSTSGTIAATTSRTRETDKYYYLDSYSGITAATATYTLDDFLATDDTLEFTVNAVTVSTSNLSSYGVVVPLDLEVGKTYTFQVQNATANLGCRLMTYAIGSDGKWTYEGNTTIAYSTTDLKTLDITPVSGKGYAIHFSQKSAGVNNKNVFSNISLTEK